MPDADKILENVILFCRALRHKGLGVTTGQVLTVVEALRHISLTRRRDVRSALRAILINRKTDLDAFHEAFDNFWNASSRKRGAELGKLLRPTSRQMNTAFLDQAVSQSASDGEEDEPDTRLRSTRIRYSNLEKLRRHDFAHLTAAELEQVKELMRQFSWSPPLRKTRRKIAARRGTDLDLRRLFRTSLRFEGWPLSLTWRSRKIRYRPLVLICDVSGSMEPYARILLQFSYVLSRGWKHVEVFLFSTRLTRITHQLRHKDIDVALDRAVSIAPDWGGGTRIGEALRDFNYRWSRRVLGGGPVVLIISDGWDRGETNRLAEEMDRLRRSCHTLIWLNPLLGTPGYQPLTLGIVAALPRVDFFLPAHNLLSLERLGSMLQGVSLATHPYPRPGDAVGASWGVRVRPPQLRGHSA